MATWQFDSENVWKQKTLATKKLFITYGNHNQIMQVEQTTARNLETVKQACQNTGPDVHNVPLGRTTINRNLGSRTGSVQWQFPKSVVPIAQNLFQKTIFSIKFVFLTINKYFALTIVFYSKLLYQTIKYLNIYQYIILVVWWVYPRPS